MVWWRSKEATSLSEELISLAEAAARFGLTTGHLRKLAREGQIKTFKIGHYWVTTAEAVQAYLAEGHKPGPKPKRERRQDR